MCLMFEYEIYAKLIPKNLNTKIYEFSKRVEKKHTKKNYIVEGDMARHKRPIFMWDVLNFATRVWRPAKFIHAEDLPWFL